MLTLILWTIAQADRPMCLADLSRELDINEPAMEGMLDTLVARGRLRTIRRLDDACGVCPIRSGCYVMADGIAATYALAS